MKMAFIAVSALAGLLAACSSNTENKAESAAQIESATPAAKAENATQITDTKIVTLSDASTFTWIKDNEGTKLNPRTLFSDASDSLYASIGMPDGIPATVSTFLAKIDGEHILFDAGLGDFGGQLARHLGELGVNLDDIKLIYLTHLHMDHISGLVKKTDAGMERVFKNAAVYLSQVEHDAWMNDIEKNDMQKAILGVYADSLHLFAFGDSLPHKVLTIDAVGHTPGHTAFRYGEMLIIGDLMHGFALQINHPEINSNYDMDKAKSIESRKRILDYAKQNNLTMAGMHLPEPGFAK